MEPSNTPQIDEIEAVSRRMAARLMEITVGAADAMASHYIARQAAGAPQEVLDAAADNLDRATRSARRTIALGRMLNKPAKPESQPKPPTQPPAQPRKDPGETATIAQTYREHVERPEDWENPEAPEPAEDSPEQELARELRSEPDLCDSLGLPAFRRPPPPPPPAEQDCFTQAEFDALPERIKQRLAGMDKPNSELVIRPPWHRLA